MIPPCRPLTRLRSAAPLRGGAGFQRSLGKCVSFPFRLEMFQERRSLLNARQSFPRSDGERGRVSGRSRGRPARRTRARQTASSPTGPGRRQVRRGANAGERAESGRPSFRNWRWPDDSPRCVPRVPPRTRELARVRRMPANVRGRRIVRGRRRRRRRRPPLPHPGQVPAAIQIAMRVPDLATSGPIVRRGTPRRREGDETPLGRHLSHVARGAARGPRRGTRTRQGVHLSPPSNAQIAVGRVARARPASPPLYQPRSIPTPGESRGRRVERVRSRASPRPRVARVVEVPRHVRRRPRSRQPTRRRQRQKFSSSPPCSVSGERPSSGRGAHGRSATPPRWTLRRPS